MASLVHTLNSFRSGTLSKDELFAEVDQMLQGGRVDEAWLLQTLKEENTKLPLPKDVHEEVQDRIVKFAEIKGHVQHDNKNNDQLEEHQVIDPDDSRTRMATSLFVGTPGPSQAGGVDKEWAPEKDGSSITLASPAEAEAMKSTGDVLNDRFVLEECIGTGGMSTVYKALDRRKLEADDRNPYVAVKVLNVEFRSHPDSLIALQREAKKSQILAHPNIVRVYDFDRDGSTVYMTMEYLSGESLAKVLRAPGFKGLPENDAMRILEDIAKALVFAHENGIIHADFKPANVILTDDGKVKVIDFGIARAFQRPDDTDMEATRFDPGSLGALTPTYASPEMLEHQEPDPRDDVYALACIVYEMLTGRHPFGRMQATEARDGGLELERRKHLSRRQWKALKSALAFDREKRTPNIRRFLNDIRPERVVSGSRPVHAIGKALLVSVAGILVYYYIIAGVIDRYQTESQVASAPADDATDGNIEIASLQNLQQDTSPSSVSLADGSGGEAVIAAKPQQQMEDNNDAVKPEKLAALSKPVKVEPELPKIAELSLASVGGILEKVPCAAFSTSVKDGAVDIKGYVSRQLDVSRLENDLLALPGAKAVNADLHQVDKEKCAVIELFSPYWVANRNTGHLASLVATGERNELTEGDPLVVEITTPDYESFVNVDYYSLDGGVVHMVPGPRAKDNQAPPNYKATIGDLGEWIISEPFGSELVTVLVTPKPLFDKLRDEYETKSDYLAAVKKQLERMDPEKNKVSVDFVMIETKPRSLLQEFRDKVTRP